MARERKRLSSRRSMTMIIILTAVEMVIGDGAVGEGAVDCKFGGNADGIDGGLVILFDFVQFEILVSIWAVPCHK